MNNYEEAISSRKKTLDVTDDEAFRKMTMEVSSARNILRSYTIVFHESDFEYEIFRRDPSLPLQHESRFDFIVVNEDIPDYTLVSFVTSNGVKGKELGEYVSSSYNLRMEETIINSTEIFSTNQVYKLYSRMIQDCAEKFSSEDLINNGACISSVIKGPETLIISNLGDNYIFLHYEIDGVPKIALVNNIHSGTDHVEAEKIAKNNIKLNYKLNLTRCIGNNYLSEWNYHNKPDVNQINMRSNGSVVYKMLIMMSKETNSHVDISKLCGYVMKYIYPKNPSTVVKTIYSQFQELKLGNDAGCFVMFFIND